MALLNVQPLRYAMVAALASLTLAGCGAPPQDTPVDPAAAPATTPAPDPVSPPAHINIPRIGVDADLEQLGLDDDGAMAVPDTAMGVGYFGGPDPAFTGDEVLPGEVGPAVIAGHVDLNGKLGVFDRLHELRPGDEVFIRQEDGGELTFVITKVEHVDKAAFPTAKVWGNTTVPSLRVITCGGELDRSTGHYRQNVVTYAELV